MRQKKGCRQGYFWLVIFLNSKSTNVPSDKTNKELAPGYFGIRICFFVIRTGFGGCFNNFIFLLKNH